jgi:tellurite resistance protein
MVDFLKIFRDRGRQPTSPNEHEAYFTVVAAAALCDRNLGSEETEELHAICRRLKMFMQLPTGELNSMIANVIGSLGRDFDGAVTSAVRSLNNNEMARSVFIQALDIVSADREINKREISFLTDLAEILEIDDGFNEKAAEIIATKNAFSSLEVYRQRPR